MSAQRFTPEFKEEAVKQVIERGYSVAEVAGRLSVSQRRASTNGATCTPFWGWTSRFPQEAIGMEILRT